MSVNNGSLRALIKVGSAVGAISAIVGGVLFIDDRYAHSADLKTLQRGQAEVVYQTQREMRYSTDLLRKQLLEDKVFELELIPPAQRTNVQRALLERYKSQIQEVNTRWPNHLGHGDGN